MLVVWESGQHGKRGKGFEVSQGLVIRMAGRGVVLLDWMCINAYAPCSCLLVAGEAGPLLMKLLVSFTRSALAGAATRLCTHTSEEECGSFGDRV
jgi:hypothetical protein